MSKHADQEFFDYNFFVISSDNLDKVQSRLYGYTIFNEKSSDDYDVYINGSLDYIPLNADGAYINIVRNNDSIEIQQDYNGSYGLYLYQKNGYFAISNSYLYLLNYLKYRVELSLNEDYVKYFIFEPLATLAVSETLINEINLVPTCKGIAINVQSKKLKINRVNEDLTNVTLNSEQGIDILDNWYYKWQSILVGLQQNNERISVDLTGGMDSRASFVPFNNPIVNMDNVLVHSSTKKLHTHEEDYEIASMIADIMDFKLNHSCALDERRLLDETSIHIAFYTKLGTHKKFYLKNNYIAGRVFYFTGFGGESIRKNWHMKPDVFANMAVDKYDFKTIDSEKSRSKIVLKSVDMLTALYGNRHDSSTMKLLYQNTRLRSHFGKNIIENFMANTINLNPLMDKALQKIHINDDALLAVIYDRYFSQINGVKFEGGRRLDENSMQNAEAINNKYPLIKKNNFGKVRIIDKTEIQPKVSSETVNVRLAMMDGFQSEKIKQLLVPVIGHEVYQRALDEWDKGGFAPDLLACSLLAIAASIESSQSNYFFEPDKNPKLYSNGKRITQILDSFKTARIDIKNIGRDGNDIHFKGKNTNYKLMKPTWFQNNGSGYVINSKGLTLTTKIKCVKDGKLEIKLRGMNVIDKNSNRIPVWVDFFSCKIDTIEQLELPRETWHDKPFIISQPVKDGEEIELFIEWKVHDYEDDEFIRLIERLYDEV